MRRKLSALCILLGVLLLCGSLGWMGYNLYDDYRAGAISQDALQELRLRIPETVAAAEPTADVPVSCRYLYYEGKNSAPTGYELIADYLLNPDMDMPEQELQGRSYIGVLSIPAISLELPIVSELSYDALQDAPCRFSGSVYLDDMIIGGHNYQRHFSPIKELSPGDVVTFTDVTGNVFTYRVMDFETLGPNDADELRGGQWDLTLFTCTAGGRSRFVLRCERIPANV